MLVSLFPLYLGVALAAPNPAPAPHPMVTPAPRAPALDSRDVVQEWDNYVNSVVSGLGSTMSNYIASGVPQFFQDLPTGKDVEAKLGIAGRDLDAKPTQVLNLPYVCSFTWLCSRKYALPSKGKILTKRQERTEITPTMESGASSCTETSTKSLISPKTS
jgi:hypothetical protein